MPNKEKGHPHTASVDEALPDEGLNDGKDRGEQAIRTLQRRLEILMLFDGRDRSMSIADVTKALHLEGDRMAYSLVRRALKQFEAAGFLQLVPGDQDEDGTGRYVRWKLLPDMAKRMKALPKFTMGEAIAFKLVKRLLKPLLPPSAYAAMLPYLEAVDKQYKMLPSWDKTNSWEEKVRVLPPTQPLLPPHAPAQDDVREQVLQALLADVQCEVTYQRPSAHEPAHWIIHPLVFVQRNTVFYLLCTIGDFSDVRQLALHRILTAKVLEDYPSKRPAGFDIEREVERSQGMGGSGTPMALVLRFYRPAGLHLFETWLSKDQVIHEKDGDDVHFRLTATVNDTAQLRWWLLSFGSQVEVLAPAHLREEMAKNACRMQQMYAPTGPDTTPCASQ